MSLMGERREFEQRYASIWRSIGNFLRNSSGLRIGGVARTGSRRRMNHRPDSDLDIIFWVSGDPGKNQVYPDLVDRLKKVLRVNAWIGSSYNVINISKDTLEIDLVLVSQKGFSEEKNQYNMVEDL